MLTIAVTVDSATPYFRGLNDNLRNALRRRVVADTQRVAAMVRDNLNGRVLHKRSGRLLKGVRSELIETATSVHGKVSVAGVPYAAIQEFGGRTRPHTILPRNANALRFRIGNATVFAKVVHHPGSNIPARSYLHSALARAMGETDSAAQAAVEGAMRRNLSAAAGAVLR